MVYWFLTASVARSQSAAPLQAVEICSVARESCALCDGKEFLVRGLWRMVIHGSILMGTACPKVEVNMTETAGYKSNKKATSIIKSVTRKDQFGSVEVVLRGTFRVAHESQCFGQMCAAYQFETAELLSAPNACSLNPCTFFAGNGCDEGQRVERWR